MELSPEEREKIYLEEKARLEVRQELDGKRVGAGAVIGYVVFAVIGLFLVLLMIGAVMESNDSAKFNALSPEQKQAQTVKNCTELEQDWAFKTYSELSEYERRVKYTCDQVLASEKYR